MTSILLITQRDRHDGFGRQPGYVGFLEAEAVLAASAGADLAPVAHGPQHPRIRLRRMGGQMVRQLRSSRQPLPNLRAPWVFPGGSGGSPGRRYDVAVFIALTVWDLPIVERMAALRRQVDRIVVWVPELWSSELDDPRMAHQPFDLADTIFVGMAAGAERLGALLGRPVHHLPMAVDVTRFAALPPDGPRPIDVLGIGRRHPELHQALLDWSRKTQRLYLYDTISGSAVADPEAHRGNLGDQYRRTKVAITNYAKWDLPEVIGAEREVPGRLWEGLASGTTMMGQPPDPALQTALLGQPLVRPLPEDPAAAVEAIDEAVNAPLGAERRLAVQTALRGHDWSHRWAALLEHTDLAVPPGLTARIERLATQADSVDELG